MSNWNLPTITSGYLDFVTEMNDKFVDAGTIGYGAPTNLPEHAMRFNRSTNIFEEWVGGGWIPKVIGIAGGGTGGSDPAAARAALGLGSMSVQNSNAVNITGGSITGVNLNADAITSGIVALARGGTGASLALGASGTVMLSNGSQVVFAPGTSITQLNAGALTVGTVPLDRLAGVGKLDSINTWNALNTFNGTIAVNTSIDLIGGYPSIIITSTTAPVNERRWSIMNYLGNFILQVQNDDGSFKGNPLSISNVGVVSANGSGIVNLNAAAINAGLVPPQHLGTGPANVGTFLRGDNTWQPMEAAGIPSGLIAIFNGGCPVGWTRFSALDNRFPLGSGGAGATGGATVHSHGVGGATDPAGVHRHSATLTGATTGNDNQYTGVPGGGGLDVSRHGHVHPVSVSGETADAGSHTHNFNVGTNNADHTPPYYTVVFCQKN